MNTITSHLRWQAAGLLLFCRAKNLISFFFVVIVIALRFSVFSVLSSLFIQRARHINGVRERSVYSMLLDPFVVHFTACCHRVTRTALIQWPIPFYMPRGDTFLAFLSRGCYDVFVRCVWVRSRVCERRRWMCLFTQSAVAMYTKNDTESSSNKQQPQQQQKYKRNGNFSCRRIIVRVYPPEWEWATGMTRAYARSQSDSGGGATMAEDQIGIVYEKYKINTTIYCLLSCSSILLCNDVWMLNVRHIAYNDAWRTHTAKDDKTTSWVLRRRRRRQKSTANCSVRAMTKFCVIRNEKKERNIWQMCQPDATGLMRRRLQHIRDRDAHQNRLRRRLYG